jgi:curved DNA-binding protein
MPNKDPYDILGVSRTAKPEEIKQAYRRLAKQWHPDRNPKNREAAEAKFKEIQAAYEVLGDPEKRAQYDQFGAGGPMPEYQTWTSRGGGVQDIPFDIGSMGDLSSIFEQFFSRGMGGSRTRRRGGPARGMGPRGQDIDFDAELTLEEALRGTEREVLLTGPEGHEERIRVRVPAGVEDGQRVRVRGKGQDGPGGRGDLMIRCHIRAHPIFKRDGRDLLVDLRLTFAEAAFGTQVEIPTLDGNTVVKVPPGTSGGTKLRLRGRGVRLPNGEAGDLYAVVRIAVPRELTPRARELIEELERELQLHPRQAFGQAK